MINYQLISDMEPKIFITISNWPLLLLLLQLLQLLPLQFTIQRLDLTTDSIAVHALFYTKPGNHL